MSPDGKPYYYNSITKESRWKLPKELRKSKAASAPEQQNSKEHPESTKSKHRQDTENSATLSSKSKHRDKDASESPAPVASNGREGVASTPTRAKNEMFQKLQASLAGRINPMVNMGPPPMIHIPRSSSSEQESNSNSNGYGNAWNSDAGGGAGAEEQQYEGETANMTAAERLRFLRRKRQEAMFAKEKIVEEDDFMKEFAQNMKKKQASQRNVVDQGARQRYHR
uniref:WW domain-containing protein n=1 Tax=Globisporangium ultimum (strain ATCC 200006 / CBS 805.95 / DAOM BR144) TaxID=431595 RepID=K3WFB9_GLOUD